MEKYSFPRRIWRIINPLLIYIGITLVVGVAAGVAIGVYIGVNDAISGGFPDPMELAADLQRLVTEYSMHILIAGNIAALAVFVPMWLKARKRIEPFKNANPFTHNLLAIGLFAAFNLVLQCVIGIFDLLRFFPSYEVVSDAISGGSLLMQVISLGVAAPVIEELCFRGVLMERMKWIPVWLAVFIQALMFGAAHLNLFQGIYAFVIGIVLALVYVKFRSIITVVIGHAAFNIINVVQDLIFDEPNVFIVLLPSVAVAAVCGALLIKRPAAHKLEDNDSSALQSQDA